MKLAQFSVAMLLAAIVAGPVRADVFELRGGGRVEGELLNPEETPRVEYRVRLDAGGEVSLAADHVEKHTAQSADEAEYARIKTGFSDTVDGQWKLAQWCREHRLFDQRDAHLERIIALDTNHAAARRGLGFTMIDGRWIKRDDEMAARGMVRYQGRWRTKQEVALIEAEHKQDLAQKDWFQKIRRWRSWLETDRAGEARANFRAIDDPMAIKALVQNLRNDPETAGRVLFAEILGRFDSAAAVEALAISAVNDAKEEVRLTCLDSLVRRKSADAVTYFCSQLKNKDNVLVNRAGEALGRMNDKSAAASLIDALVTTHKYKVTSGKKDGYNVGFGSGGPGGMSVGDSTKVVTEQHANQAVLDALVAITGQNYHFDENLWRKWYVSERQQHREGFDARRD